MVATCIKNIMHIMICVTGAYSRAIMNMFFIGQVSGLVEDFNIRISSDTKNVINVKLCRGVLFID